MIFWGCLSLSSWLYLILLVILFLPQEESLDNQPVVMFSLLGGAIWMIQPTLNFQTFALFGHLPHRFVLQQERSNNFVGGGRVGHHGGK
jgi:hypothetical protein